MKPAPSEKPLVRILFPIFCSNSAIPSCILALADRFEGAAFKREYWAPAVAPGVLRDYHRVPLPFFMARVYYRLGLPESGLRALLERKFLDEIETPDLAYLWPACSVELFRELKARGVRIVLERVNSHRRNSMRVLDEAYRRLGLPAVHGIRMRDADEESEKLELVDRVFCPSTYVRDSLLEAGLPEAKILDTSYGWDPKQFQVPEFVRPLSAAPKFLFVANGTVRKGLAQLLEYWAAANVPGQLIIVGPIERQLADLYGRELSRPNVQHLPYRAQLADLYKEADVFVLGSHEEGSPLVTYLALAAGLPCLVSPAAAGGVVRDGLEGLVRSPYDEVGWVSALRELAGSPELRLRLGQAARQHSLQYTWENVASRRQAQLEELLGVGGRRVLQRFNPAHQDQR